MTRFAIYFAPPEDSPLTRLAAAWLGRDAFRGSSPPHRSFTNGLPREIWRAATSDPRLYGFHATLKSPFRLISAHTESGLAERLRTFSKRQGPFQAPALRVTTISSFVALTLSERCPEFENLAACCVREFDEFRAPALEEELIRRRRSRLSPKHLENLYQWGYPYVMEKWQFHMTLTSPLDLPLREKISAHLSELFAPHCGEPIEVDSVCLFRQLGAGVPFEMIERFPFA